MSKFDKRGSNTPRSFGNSHAEATAEHIRYGMMYELVKEKQRDRGRPGETYVRCIEGIL